MQASGRMVLYSHGGVEALLVRVRVRVMVRVMVRGMCRGTVRGMVRVKVRVGIRDRIKGLLEYLGLFGLGLGLVLGPGVA